MARLSLGMIAKADREAFGNTLAVLAATFGLGEEMHLVELGCHRGATANGVVEHLRSEGMACTYVAVDNGVSGVQAALSWPHMSLIQGDALSDETLVRVASLLGGRVHWCLVDACHCYACTMEAWKRYGPLVVPGGILVFHDVAPWTKGTRDRVTRNDHESFGACDAWPEIRSSRGWQIVAEQLDRPGYGVGALQRVR